MKLVDCITRILFCTSEKLRTRCAFDSLVCLADYCRPEVSALSPLNLWTCVCCVRIGFFIPKATLTLLKRVVLEEQLAHPTAHAGPVGAEQWSHRKKYSHFLVISRTCHFKTTECEFWYSFTRSVCRNLTYHWRLLSNLPKFLTHDYKQCRNILIQ